MTLSLSVALEYGEEDDIEGGKGGIEHIALHVAAQRPHLREDVATVLDHCSLVPPQFAPRTISCHTWSYLKIIWL